MDPITIAKAYALRLRKNPVPSINLNHDQALELAVALTCQANSWNDFVTHPTAPAFASTVETYFAAIARTQHRMLALGVGPALSRGTRSWVAMCFMATVANSLKEPLAPLWTLMDAEGVRPLMVYDDGVYRPAQLSENPGYAAHRLAIWFFEQHLGGKRELGNYPWDVTEKLALQMGFSAQEASIIRELQREAPNQGWELDLWCEVGVLDPDQNAFLTELKNQIDWQSQFRELYESNGYPADLG